MIEFDYYKVPVGIMGEAFHHLFKVPCNKSGVAVSEFDEVKKFVATYGCGFENSILPEVILTRLGALRHAVQNYDLSDWAWQVDDDTWGTSKPFVHAAGRAPLKMIGGRLCFDVDDLRKLAAAFAEEDEE